MRSIELALDAHSLVERNRGHIESTQREQLIGAAGETRRGRLPLYAALPLPPTQAHKDCSEQQGEQREAQSGRKAAPG